MTSANEEKCGFLVEGKMGPLNALFTAVGVWTVHHAGAIDDLLKQSVCPRKQEIAISLSGIEGLDTSGVWLLIKLKRTWENEGCKVDFVDVRPEHVTLLNAISSAADDMRNRPIEKERVMGVAEATLDFFQRGIDDTKRITSLLGALTAAFYRRMVALFLGIFGRKPNAQDMFRLPALITHVMRTGLTAVPIIALMSFLIGAIVAQQGAYQLSFYGADPMAVDLVAVLVTRDMGVLLTAIMVAGRSGSAYTAEIGSMKMREEIDALKVIGLDPVDVLLFPRIAGLIVALPLLTVIADYASLLGAQVALWLYIDMSWEIFLQRTREAVPLAYFLMGVIKAPFMALIIGLISMSEGLRVSGSSESLSHHTTVSVVKSIFMVIVVDGVFAVISASLGY